ncbi:hypothetical protein [Corallococcus exiguus]|uniref:Uncharacterized protein n=1 Tax=Corallococcus exiguus TaxID=83462 RepID=A0A7X4Y9V5_9BACT|nr:hypothetical protein [Corallococcus exiguus]NBC40462.1 hypothetical protein [Corallococcus exiguus]TNV64055.1 hypothetical protein FH620_13530 [Corallococcus exiguus]
MSSPSTPSAASTPSTETAHWRMASTESLAKSIQEAEGCSPEESLAKAQEMADTVQGEPSEVDRKVGDFHVAATADISSAAAELKALDAQLQETADSIVKVASAPVTPVALAGLIDASASAFRALSVRDNSGAWVDEKVTNQVAADVAALVARARALACRE